MGYADAPLSFSVYALTGMRRRKALQLEADDFAPARATLTLRAGKGGRPLSAQRQ